MRQFILLVTLTAFLATSVSLNSKSIEAAVPKGNYGGITSDLGWVDLEIDGFSLSSFGTTTPLQPVTNICASSASGIGANVSTGSFSAGSSIVDRNGVRTDVQYSGFIDQSGFATGTFKALPTAANSCVARNVSWAAVVSPGTRPVTPGSTYSGTTDKGGAVRFRTSASNTLTSVSVALPGNCPPVASSSTFTLTENVANIGSASVGAVRVWFSGDRAVGVYATPTSLPTGCVAAIGTFSAVVESGGSPTPVATSTVAPSAGGVVGAAPGSGAAGLLVTGGPSSASQIVAELGGRGCAVGSLAVLRGGTWLVYVNGAPAVVNSAFPGSLEATTPFFVRCT